MIAWSRKLFTQCYNQRKDKFTCEQNSSYKIMLVNNTFLFWFLEFWAVLFSRGVQEQGIFLGFFAFSLMHLTHLFATKPGIFPFWKKNANA